MTQKPTWKVKLHYWSVQIKLFVLGLLGFYSLLDKEYKDHIWLLVSQYVTPSQLAAAVTIVTLAAQFYSQKKVRDIQNGITKP